MLSRKNFKADYKSGTDNIKNLYLIKHIRYCKIHQICNNNSDKLKLLPQFPTINR